MTKKLTLLLLFILTQTAFSQVRFQDGYYITKEGEKIVCQLEMRDWVSWNNTELTVKGDQGISKVPIATISEFGVGNEVKFITAITELDSSYNDLRKLDFSPYPKFESKTLLLKVIVEGEYSLYQYLDSNIRKYFYQTQGSPIKQLIFKKYFYESSSRIKENNGYLDQLKAINVCKNNPYLVNYEYEALKAYFLNLNECSANDVTFFEKSAVNPSFGLGVFGGVNLAAFKVKRLTLQEFATINTTSATFGVEGNYTLPLITNALRFNLSVSYSSFDVSDAVVFPPFTSARDVTFTYSDILVGGEAKYLFYVAQKNYVSVGIGLYTPIIIEDYTYTETVSNLDVSNNQGIKAVAGIILGYNFDKLSISAYYSSGTGNLFEGINNFEANLQRQFSLRIGYQIL